MHKFYFSFFLIFFSVFCRSQVLQHQVDSLESLETIVNLYEVSEEDLILLNPDVKDNFFIGKYLIVPNFKRKNNVSYVKELISYKLHRVRKKETLYGISVKYGVSLEEIRINNKHLNGELKSKTKLYIPKYKKRKVSSSNLIENYAVKAGDTWWSILKKYGITDNQLKLLNPDLDTILKTGKIIKLPNIDFKSVKDEKNNELYLLNENLDLKSKYLNPKSIALILPFNAHEISFDSTNLAKQQIQRNVYTKISTDFYNGVRTGLDSLQRLGISIKLDVFDSEANVDVLKKLINENDFSKYDVIIGPIRLENLNFLAQFLEDDKINVISPFVKLNKRTSNLIQTIPSDEYMSNKMLEFAKKVGVSHNILIISDSKSIHRADKILSFFPKARILKSEKNKEGEEQFYINYDKVKESIKSGKTLVFLETNNESFASNVTSMLSGLNQTNKKFKDNSNIILMTTNLNSAFMGDNISNIDLSNLNFQFPSVRFENQPSNPFSLNFKKSFGIYPNKYVSRGFDLTLDVVLRLVNFGNFSSQLTSAETSFTENRFKYVKSKSGGYVNQSGFILKHQNLFIIKMAEF